ncbi:MAG: heme exporter protein CcmD [Hyphomicrobiaceae bacterium]|nr:heme exporter protein CcmD [Hyphomicrobiaceae bacterium]
MDLGPHAVFIWLCYGAVAIVVIGLILVQHLEGRRLARQLADLEAAGMRRVASPADGGGGL